jgi:hypothetical protein
LKTPRPYPLPHSCTADTQPRMPIYFFFLACFFSPLLFCYAQAVPMENPWLFFDIQTEGNDAVIKWAMAPDSTINAFQIEKTIDQRIFEVVGQVKARVSPDPDYHLYEFTDRNMRAGMQEGQVIYYRLRAIDKHQNQPYSATKSLLIGKPSPVLRLMPNPASEELRIYFPPLSGEWRYLRILDQAGKLVFQEAFHPESSATLHISLVNWPRGVYFCQLQSETYSAYRKLLVQ